MNGSKLLSSLGVQAIIFDFGGTLDAGGRHWSDVIGSAYRKLEMDYVGEAAMRAAYVFAERQLAIPGRVVPGMDFAELLTLKMQIQLGWLAHNGHLSWDEAERGVAPLVSICLGVSDRETAKSAAVLDKFAGERPLAAVSNFYGNLDTVLRGCGLRRYFSSVIDSAAIGVRKPDPRIFGIGCVALGFEPRSVAVVGDSINNDILPAIEAGCRAVLYSPEGKLPDKAKELAHDVPVIGSLEELADIL